MRQNATTAGYARTIMMSLFAVFAVTAMTATIPHAIHAAEVPDVTVSIDRPTYHYCERLAYTISVSEVVGGVAIVHIIDQEQKSSQAIPTPIQTLDNTINAPFPFERSIFPTGTYTIDVAYSGGHASATFELADSDSICIPTQIRQITAAWLSGAIPDGFLVDAIKKTVDPRLIDVPFDARGGDGIYQVVIPEWVKATAYWWITDEISDETMAGAFDYLLETGIISMQKMYGNGELPDEELGV